MPGFRIAMIDSSLHRQEWSAALAACEPSRAKVLKREGDNAVYRADILDRGVVIKVRTLRGMSERLKALTRTSRAFRHWRGAKRLTELGFQAARPLVLGYRRGQEWLVLEAVHGRSLIDHIAKGDLGPRQEHDLAQELGRHISAMRKAGWFNRDFKPSNIMVRPGADKPKIVVIDCVAIRRGGGAPDRMLHALAVEPLGLGILPRRAIMARVIAEMVEADFEGASEEREALRLAKWATRRAFWDLVRESIRQHGDPTPRTSPLEQG